MGLKECLVSTCKERESLRIAATRSGWVVLPSDWLEDIEVGIGKVEVGWKTAK